MDEEYRCRCGVVLDRDGYNGRDDETMGGQYMGGRALRERTASLRPPDEKDRDVREGCMLAGVFQRARGIKVMRLGIPCHFTPDNPHAAACGVEWPALGSPDVARVDCFRCRRTRAFKTAIKQTCKGGAV